MKIDALRESDIVRRPWKNGRGETAEIVVWPRTAEFARGDFRWRLSRAAVVEDGPFSAFPGFDRRLILLDGDGLAIDHAGAAPKVELRPLSPYGFRGEWSTSARLLGGPVNDFNVMLARGQAAGRVQVLTTFSTPLAVDGDHVLVHVVRGALRATIDGESHALSAFETLHVECERGPVTIALGDAAESTLAILVEIEEQGADSRK